MYIKLHLVDLINKLHQTITLIHTKHDASIHVSDMWTCGCRCCEWHVNMWLQVLWVTC